jgi:hypothetical protein
MSWGRELPKTYNLFVYASVDLAVVREGGRGGERSELNLIDLEGGDGDCFGGT